MAMSKTQNKNENFYKRVGVIKALGSMATGG